MCTQQRCVFAATPYSESWLLFQTLVWHLHPPLRRPSPRFPRHAAQVLLPKICPGARVNDPVFAHSAVAWQHASIPGERGGLKTIPDQSAVTRPAAAAPDRPRRWGEGAWRVRWRAAPGCCTPCRSIHVYRLEVDTRTRDLGGNAASLGSRHPGKFSSHIQVGLGSQSVEMNPDMYAARRTV